MIYDKLHIHMYGNYMYGRSTRAQSQNILGVRILVLSKTECCTRDVPSCRVMHICTNGIWAQKDTN